MRFNAAKCNIVAIVTSHKLCRRYCLGRNQNEKQGENDYWGSLQLYRSPNSSGQQNDKLWETLINMSDTYMDNLLIMGDFNCGGINWIDVMTSEYNMDALNNKLIEVLRDCFLEQVITENTRARGTNVPSLIDLVLCNDRELINNINYLSPLGKSDHCIITFTYNVSYETSAYKIRRIFYEKGDYASIRKF